MWVRRLGRCLAGYGSLTLRAGEGAGRPLEAGRGLSHSGVWQARPLSSQSLGHQTLPGARTSRACVLLGLVRGWVLKCGYTCSAGGPGSQLMAHPGVARTESPGMGA